MPLLDTPEGTLLILLTILANILANRDGRRAGLCAGFFKVGFFVLFGLLVVAGMRPAFAANILIVDAPGGAFPSFPSGASTTLVQDLTGVAGVACPDVTTGNGNTVTCVNTGVPASLAGFTQIYDIRVTNSPVFTVGEMDQYVTFLNTPGNALVLLGEFGGGQFTPRNTVVNQFIALAGGGTIAVPSSVGDLESVQPPFSGPNAITSITFEACGIVTSSGTGSFATTEADGTSGCALAFTPGTLANATAGALVVVYDVNFTYDGNGANNVPFRFNLEHYVSNLAAFAGIPGDVHCHHDSVSALLHRYGGMGPAAQALSFSSVPALQTAIIAFCGFTRH